MHPLLKPIQKRNVFAFIVSPVFLNLNRFASPPVGKTVSTAKGEIYLHGLCELCILMMINEHFRNCGPLSCLL